MIIYSGHGPSLGEGNVSRSERGRAPRRRRSCLVRFGGRRTWQAASNDSLTRSTPPSEGMDGHVHWAIERGALVSVPAVAHAPRAREFEHVRAALGRIRARNGDGDSTAEVLSAGVARGVPRSHAPAVCAAKSAAVAFPLAAADAADFAVEILCDLRLCVAPAASIDAARRWTRGALRLLVTQFRNWQIFEPAPDVRAGQRKDPFERLQSLLDVVFCIQPLR